VDEYLSRRGDNGFEPKFVLAVFCANRDNNIHSTNNIIAVKRNNNNPSNEQIYFCFNCNNINHILIKLNSIKKLSQHFTN